MPRSLGWSAPLLVLLFAAGLRIPGLFTDFWLDEIWSWALAAPIQSPWEILTSLHADNNNHLNTLWLWLWGPSAAVWQYRLHSFVASLAMVGGVMGLASRWSDGDRRTILASGLTASTSAVFVVYASEARGYALAMAAAAGGQWVLGRAIRERRWSDWLAWLVVCLGGFLSHLSFLPVWLAQIAWIGVEGFAQRGRLGGAKKPSTWKMKACTAISLVGLGILALYEVDLRHAQVGGGPQLDPLLVSIDTLAEPFSPWGGLLSLIAAFLYPALVLIGIYAVRQHSGESRREALVPLLVLIVAPLVLFGLAPSGLVYPRHFLVALTLLFPAAGAGWVELMRSGGGKRFAALLAVAMWVVGNGNSLTNFYAYGRGGYTSALRDITVISPSGPVLVGSDHDFRNGLVIGFLHQRNPEFARVEYRPQGQWPAHGVDVLILHQLEGEPQFPGKFDAAGNSYQLVKVYRFSGPVGWHWAIYHREELAQ